MGMYDNLNDIVKVLRNDETLLRLLYYPVENLLTKQPDPLDIKLPDILKMNEDVLWEIRDEHIFTIPKSDDLEEKQICRIYVYAGRRNPQTQNYIMANQEIIVDILCHHEFEKDLRSMRISDRINELLIDTRVTGIGKSDYNSGIPIGSPSGYVGYRHVYVIGSTKK